MEKYEEQHHIFKTPNREVIQLKQTWVKPFLPSLRIVLQARLSPKLQIFLPLQRSAVLVSLSQPMHHQQIRYQ